ncbi:acetate/propionate family kinase [Paenibacillus beijingensis]|uniref:Acetate kinase n=1 Tax=Paenibacillus beijingensis TaxID=1126833 RepID=A0A0D5NJD8_9BACL|nr:acetate kinase [Paenibacillus beijingensis]AJY75381.1 acetate kinase [Paenibacillus beijingensis]
MNILVIHSGSSSLHYQLLDMPSEAWIVKGSIERIGTGDALYTSQRRDGAVGMETRELADHDAAVSFLLRVLSDRADGAVQSVHDIHAVGHRIAHGGEFFKSAVLIDGDVKIKIKQLYDLAPLHNPPQMKGVSAVQKYLADTPQVAVFDSAFHQTMPSRAYRYAIPNALYRKHGIRKYGFHGSTHEYVSRRAAGMLNVPLEQLKIVSCHIGNEASCTAVEFGRSVDTSMGMTPLEGLMTGTQSGDLDPAVLLFLMRKEDLTANEISSLLHKHSGLSGISGISGDVPELIAAAGGGNSSAQLALDMYEYRIIKYIGAYAAAMNGIDALVFTGDVGEGCAAMRARICRQLSYAGIRLDDAMNGTGPFGEGEPPAPAEQVISSADSGVSVLVIPADEALLIARKTYELLRERTKN